jgi:hypothetical protein
MRPTNTLSIDKIRLEAVEPIKGFASPQSFSQAFGHRKKIRSYDISSSERKHSCRLVTETIMTSSQIIVLITGKFLLKSKDGNANTD